MHCWHYDYAKAVHSWVMSKLIIMFLSCTNFSFPTDNCLVSLFVFFSVNLPLIQLQTLCLLSKSLFKIFRWLIFYQFAFLQKSFVAVLWYVPTRIGFPLGLVHSYYPGIPLQHPPVHSLCLSCVLDFHLFPESHVFLLTGLFPPLGGAHLAATSWERKCGR